MNDWEAFRIFLGVCLAISVISTAIFAWLVYTTNLADIGYVVALFVSALSTGYFGFANVKASK